MTPKLSFFQWPLSLFRCNGSTSSARVHLTLGKTSRPCLLRILQESLLDRLPGLSLETANKITMNRYGNITVASRRCAQQFQISQTMMYLSSFLKGSGSDGSIKISTGIFQRILKIFESMCRT